MKSILKTLAIVAAMSVLCGCGTIGARNYPSCEPRVTPWFVGAYPATRYDWFVVRTGGAMMQSDEAPQSAKVGGWTVVAPLFLIDMPISAVIDTLLLPTDIHWAAKLSNAETNRIEP